MGGLKLCVSYDIIMRFKGNGVEQAYYGRDDFRGIASLQWRAVSGESNLNSILEQLEPGDEIVAAYQPSSDNSLEYSGALSNAVMNA